MIDKDKPNMTHVASAASQKQATRPISAFCSTRWHWSGRLVSVKPLPLGGNACNAPALMTGKGE